MIYTSTSCLKGNNEKFNSSVFDVLNKFSSEGIKNIELGASHNPCDDVKELIRLQNEYNLNYIIHGPFFNIHRNFFMNLGSLNKEVLRHSLDISKKTIENAHQLGCKHWGFHPPYLKDFGVEQKDPFDYETVYSTFINSMNELLNLADDYNIRFAIETNILENEFIAFTKPAEFDRLFFDIGDKRVGMLLDHGHVRLNANKLGFDWKDFIKFEDRIFEMHCHDIIDGKDHQKLRSLDIFDGFDKSKLNNMCLTLESNNMSMTDIKDSLSIMKKL